MRPWRTTKGPFFDYVIRELQCGHGDEAVENPDHALQGHQHAMLQCGHGDEAVENLSGGRLYLVSRVELQCGHGDEAVENTPEPLMMPSPIMLQCGHGDEAVENGARASPAPRWWPSFNAATAMRPWRTASRTAQSADSEPLQCGHGDEAVENSGPCPVDRSSCCGFNAATAMRPWRTHLLLRQRHGQRFASMRPRR